MSTSKRKRSGRTGRGGTAAVQGSAASPRAAGQAGKTASSLRAGGDRASLPVAAGIGAAIAVVTIVLVSIGYDRALFAPFYVVRVAPLLPLALAAALVAVVAARGRGGPLRFDAADLAAAAFAGWQVVSALASPAPTVAFFGYYNRGAGAIFWVALALAFVAFRRLLVGEGVRRVLTWAVAAVLVAAAVVAIAQAFGAPGLWGGSGSADRLTGPTGNPIHLGGLGLLAVWLLAGLPGWRPRTPTWLAALVGAAAGAACVVLSVSRAAMLALVVCAVVGVILALIRRRRRALLVIAGLAALVVVLVAAHSAGPGDSVLGRFRAAGGGMNTSDDKRIELWSEALRGVADRPLAGVGSGAFVVADRLHRPAERLVDRPWELASDPHSLPLLVASTSGIVGLSLGCLWVAAVVVLLWRRARGRPVAGGAEGASHRAPAMPQATASDPLGAGTGAAAALFALLAAACYLVVSPLDAVVACPLIVVLALGAGPPRPGGRLSWAVGWPTSPSMRAVVWGGSVVVVGACLVFSTWAAAAWYRADRQFGSFARTSVLADATSAAGTWPYEPFYALEAGSRTWRSGLQASDEALIAEGKALVARAVRSDPTAALGPADLARLDIARGRAEDAARGLRRALSWNPHHPVLQGLWGFSALVAQEQLKDPQLAQELLGGLERLPVDTPDGWYWLGRVRESRGDAAGAREARQEAARLAPKLGSWRYRQRLLADR